MVTSLFELAIDHLGKVFDDDDRHGTALVFTSKVVSRTQVIVWALDDFAGTIDPQDGYRSLYVTDQGDHLSETIGRFRKCYKRRTRHRPWDRVIEHSCMNLRESTHFAYTVDVTFDRLHHQIKPGALDLLILDERRSGNMEKYWEVVQQLQPDMTIVMMKHLPPESPWVQFGSSFELSGNIHPQVSRSARRKPRRK